MKPNIVIVMVDQMRWDLRKAKGYPLDTMPFLDSLSSRGLEFDRAYTPNPTCMPARVSMLTGRVPSCHNVRTNHNAEDAVYTDDMIDVLKENGYLVGLCGKNHSHLRAEDMDWWEETSHLGAEPGAALTPDEAAFDSFMKTLNFCDSMTASPFTVKEQLPYRNVSSFFRFMDKALGEKKPFFSWVSIAEPHNPYQVPHPYFDMFPPESLPPLAAGKEDIRDPKMAFLRRAWEKVYGSDLEARYQRDRSNYLGMLRLIDDQLRRLVEGIEERGAMNDTLVVFLSDHGEFVGDYGLIRKGAGVAELLAHIPMVMFGAGVEKKGHDEKDFVSIIDIFPTLCDLIGTEVPFGVQGRSLAPILSGRPYPEKDFETGYSESGFGGLYWDDEDDLDPVREGATKDWHQFDCLDTWSQAGQVRMIRKGDWKLVVDMMGSKALYDISRDPYELNDLSSDPAFKDVLAEMALEFAAEVLRKADNIPSCRARYRTKVHPRGYWFDDEFHVTADPGVKYYPVECKKRRNDAR